MQWIARMTVVVVAAVAALAPGPATAQEAPAGERVEWSKDLPTALSDAKTADKVVMVCINAKFVDGREVEETAAKGLREVVYRDPRVVTLSRDFVCVLLTKQGSSEEYDALRKLGVEDPIISPQHLFISPDGERILQRREYWSHGKGEVAVEELTQMMKRAKYAWSEPDAPPPDAGADDGVDGVPEGPSVPKAGDERTKWIAERMEKLAAGGNERDRALEQLVKADHDGDCVGPLIAMLPENQKNISLLWALIRALGRDGLDAAAIPIAEQLKHKDPLIVANAAVSLEYIGSGDKNVVAALRRLADKTKDDAIANHAYRALGRCGREDAKVRTLLLKQAGSAKSEFASYGPCMALAYFEGDEKAMRGVEKLLKQIGVPGGRRGGGQNSVKRGLVSWTLASIGDAKSATFMREELIDGLENVKAFWVEGLRNFWQTVAEVCDGEKDRLGEVEVGVGFFVRFAKGADLQRYGAEDGNLMDEARTGRDTTDFKPKGDGLLDVGD